MKYLTHDGQPRQAAGPARFALKLRDAQQDIELFLGWIIWRLSIRCLELGPLRPYGSRRGYCEWSMRWWRRELRNWCMRQAGRQDLDLNPDEFLGCTLAMDDMSDDQLKTLMVGLVEPHFEPIILRPRPTAKSRPALQPSSLSNLMEVS